MPARIDNSKLYFLKQTREWEIANGLDTSFTDQQIADAEQEARADEADIAARETLAGQREQNIQFKPLEFGLKQQGIQDKTARTGIMQQAVDVRDKSVEYQKEGRQESLGFKREQAGLTRQRQSEQDQMREVENLNSDLNRLFGIEQRVIAEKNRLNTLRETYQYQPGSSEWEEYINKPMLRLKTQLDEIDKAKEKLQARLDQLGAVPSSQPAGGLGMPTTQPAAGMGAPGMMPTTQPSAGESAPQGGMPQAQAAPDPRLVEAIRQMARSSPDPNKRAAAQQLLQKHGIQP